MIHNIAERNWIDEIDSITPEHMRIGRDFMIMDSFRIPAMVNNAFRVENYTTVVFCETGEAVFTVDMKEYHVKAPYMFTMMCGKIIQHKYVSPEYSANIIVASDKFFSEIIGSNSLNNALAMFVNESPVIPLNDISVSVISEYLHLLENAVADLSNPMRLEVVKHLTLAMYYGYGNRFLITADKNKASRNDDIMDNFISLLEQWHKNERRLVFYADKMCLTPKYLSSVIHKTSGKTAAQWIDEAVMLETKTLLHCTDKTVQQIANELHFPDQSTFGKYFKHLSGLSPKEYRKSIR